MNQPLQIPMFIEMSYWDDEVEVKVLEAWEPGWLLAGNLGPYYYCHRYLTLGAPWPEDWQCEEVDYSMA